MFEDINLISYRESRLLYKKQRDLLKELKENLTGDLLIRLALLQTLPPVCDSVGAVRILQSCMINHFDYLIIGAYLCAESLELDDNIFLEKLLGEADHLENSQKSVVKYLQALHEYNRSQYASQSVLLAISESIDLCDRFPANNFLRFLISNDATYKHKAKKNVRNVLKQGEMSYLSMDDMIDPNRYIEEKITMITLTETAYNAMFVDI